MAQRTLIRDAGGTTRLVKSDRLFVVDSGGTTRKLKRMFVIDAGGVARQVYQNAIYGPLPVGAHDDIDIFALGFAQVRVKVNGAAGTWDITGATAGPLDGNNWVTPTTLAPGAYTIRMHRNSGSAADVVSTAFDVDFALTGGNPEWIWSQTGAGAKAANLTMTLKDGGGNVLATGTFDVSAQV